MLMQIWKFYFRYGFILCVALASQALAATHNLENAYFKIVTNDATGWPISIISKNPTAYELLGSTVPFAFYIQENSTGNQFDLSTVDSVSSDANSITYVVRPSNPSWNGVLSATLKYVQIDANSEMIQCQAILNVNQNLSGSYTIRYGFGFNPSNWDRHFYVGSPRENILLVSGNGYQMYDPRGNYPLMSRQGEKKLYFGTSLDSATDSRGYPYQHIEMPASDNQNIWSELYYGYAGIAVPIVTAERSDRLVAAACFDSGQLYCFVSDSEGGRGTFPMLQRFPVGLTVGQQFNFDLQFKSFKKPDNSFTQVMSWYLDNVYSSNPATQGSVGRSYASAPRPLNSGMNWWGPIETLPRKQIPYTTAAENLMIQQNMKTLWWTTGWSVFDELYPLDTRPYYDELQYQWSKAEMKYEIARQKAAGLYPCIYRRAWLIKEGCSDTQIPYNSWLLYPSSPFETMNLNSNLQGVYGVSQIHKCGADIRNSDYRTWWINQLKGELDYYKPSGMSFDGASDSGLGLISCLKSVKDYAGTTYPTMRFIGNESMFSVIALHLDSFLIEGVDQSGKTDIAFQSAKAFARPFFALNYRTSYATDIDFYMADMKALARGGLTMISNGNEPLYAILQPLYDFTNAALPLKPVAEPLASYNISDSAVIASSWAGTNKLLLAVYNTKSTSVNLNIKVDLGIIASKYGLTGSLVVDSKKIMNATTGHSEATGITVSGTPQLKYISGTLGSNELLYIYGSPAAPMCGDYWHQYPDGDINMDCYVNFVDMAMMASNWLVSLDFNDLQVMANNWLWCSDPSAPCNYNP
jgi:hypothetical protein